MGGAASSGGIATERSAAVFQWETASGPRSTASTDGGGQRVLIIDNNLLTAETIAVALTQLNFNARFAIPATPENLPGLVDWHPQVALLDIDSVSTLVALACIRVLRGAGVPTAVMASSIDTPLAGEFVQAGAISVVEKGTSLVQLVRTLLRIVEGREVLTAPTKRALIEGRERFAGFDILTHREKAVLAQLMDGHCADAIARASYVSISTVRSQIKAILQKLGVNSQLAAASLARQVGWTFVCPPERSLSSSCEVLHNRS